MFYKVKLFGNLLFFCFEYLLITNFRERDTLVVDHSKAGLQSVLKELQLEGHSSSNSQFNKVGKVFKVLFDELSYLCSKFT